MLPLLLGASCLRSLAGLCFERSFSGIRNSRGIIANVVIYILELYCIETEGIILCREK